MSYLPLIAGASGVSAAAGYFGGRSDRKARQRASAQMMKFLKQGRADFAPWVQKGIEASEQWMNMAREGPGEYEESPGFRLALEEGRKLTERSAAAKGGLTSGATGKALTLFGQQSAQGDYDRFLDRYYRSMQPFQAMSQQGLQAAGGQANLTAGLGGQAAGLTAQGGRGDEFASLSNAAVSGMENYAFMEGMQGMGLGNTPEQTAAASSGYGPIRNSPLNNRDYQPYPGFGQFQGRGSYLNNWGYN